MELYNYRAKIVSVYDGDTFKAEIDLGFSVQIAITLRLSRVDTPELRGDEREQGLIVRDIVREMLLDKEVIITTFKDRMGKYGRYLAEVYIGDINLSDWLLENGYATVYVE